MKLFRNQAAGLATLGLFTGFSMSAVQGCDSGDGGLIGDLAEQCGLVCPDEGLAEGNASISGVASVDAFFGAVVNVQTVSANIEANIRAELVGLAALLEIQGAADLSTDALAAAVEAELTAKISANVEGSLTVKYQPAECKASLEVTAQAAAKCDVEADPGSVSASCEGSCEIDASAQADCRAQGSLRCEGTAPMLACSGTCTGQCRLEAAAACEGTCRGTCSGTCSAQDGNGNCEGTCMGDCQGSCELEAGGSCSGSCEGSCEWDPGMVDCEASASAKCEASADASVECSGSCEGEVVPPSVSAECEASVEAEAKANVECTPPSLDVEFQFAAGLDAQAQAEFRAFLEGFKARFAGMVAVSAKADIVLVAVGDLTASAGGAVKGAIDAQASGDVDLKVSIGLGCALKELDQVGASLQAASGSLTASANAFASVAGVVGG